MVLVEPNVFCKRSAGNRGGHTGSTQRSSEAEVPLLCPRMFLLDSFRDFAVVDNVENQGRRWR